MSKHQSKKNKGAAITQLLSLNENGKKSWDLIENRHQEVENYFSSGAHSEDRAKVSAALNNFKPNGNLTADYNELMLIIDPIINPHADDDISVGY